MMCLRLPRFLMARVGTVDPLAVEFSDWHIRLQFQIIEAKGKQVEAAVKELRAMVGGVK